MNFEVRVRRRSGRCTCVRRSFVVSNARVVSETDAFFSNWGGAFKVGSLVCLDSVACWVEVEG